jgi:hypothetical protein
LNGIQGLLDEAILTDAVNRAVHQIRAQQTLLPEQQHSIEQELAQVEGRLHRLVEAIATGRATESVFAELERDERKKKALAAQLANISTLNRFATGDVTRLEEFLCPAARYEGSLGSSYTPNPTNPAEDYRRENRVHPLRR